MAGSASNHVLKSLIGRVQIFFRWVGESRRSVIGLLAAAALVGSLLLGCSSVLRNSEGFYEKIPRRPINWREYMTD